MHDNRTRDTMTDEDIRLERFHVAPMPEVSPTQGIRVFDSKGREICVLPPSVKLYAYLIAALSRELKVMVSR